jgi:hypothetical protein
MQQDDAPAQPSDWVTGPLASSDGGGAHPMDVRDAGQRVVDSTVETTHRVPTQSKRVPRGQRSRLQKLRKSSKLERAMGVADRIEKRAAVQQIKTAKKRAGKGLWVTESGKTKR